MGNDISRKIKQKNDSQYRVNSMDQKATIHETATGVVHVADPAAYQKPIAPGKNISIGTSGNAQVINAIMNLIEGKNITLSAPDPITGAVKITGTIGGKEVDLTSLVDGYALTYDATAGKFILAPAGSELTQATETELGGIMAKERTTEAGEVAIDPATGKLYAPASEGGGGTEIIYYETKVSVGKPYTVTAASTSFPDTGGLELTDGIIASSLAYTDAKYVGWQNKPIVVVIDLEAIIEVTAVAIHGLAHPAMGVYIPSAIAISSSEDNVTFSSIGPVTPSGGASQEKTKFVKQFNSTSARYIKFEITNGGEWLLIDEIEVFGANALFHGLPSGGTTGQILAKASEKNHDTGWIDPPVGGVSGIGMEHPFTKPSLSMFEMIRAGTGSLVDTENGVRVFGPGTASNTNALNYLARPIVPGANGWKATARIRRHSPLTGWGMMGMFVRDSVSGKSVCYGIGVDSSIGMWRNQFSSDLLWNSVTKIGTASDLDFWIRIHDDNASRRVYISRYGDFWQLLYTEPSNGYVLPTHVGIYMNPNFGHADSASFREAVGFDCFSWKFETL